MTRTKRADPWRVLIASSHPIFGEGLRSLLQKRGAADVVVLGLVSTINEALAALHTLHPDLIIVDYDDERVNRDEFLARFVEGEGRLRVVLLSLQEGGDEAIIYDRRSLAAAQIDDWLEKWTETEAPLREIENEFDPERGENAKPHRRDGMKHFVAAALVVIALILAGFFALDRINLLPPQASLQAQAIDGLFDLHFKVIIYLFALIVGLMIYSIVVFRRRPGDETDGPHVEGSTTLEVLWAVVPLAAVLYVAYIGSLVLGDIQRIVPRALEVEVIGSQWAWRFEYPDYDIISTELVLPVNQQAVLRLTSTDVIHSFWVPEFRVKQDTLPGGAEMVRNLRVTPTEVGEYKVRCAELCGQLHGAMLAPVIVLSEGEFEAWVAQRIGASAGDPLAPGEQTDGSLAIVESSK